MKVNNPFPVQWYVLYMMIYSAGISDTTPVNLTESQFLSIPGHHFLLGGITDGKRKLLGQFWHPGFPFWWFGKKAEVTNHLFWSKAFEKRLVLTYHWWFCKNGLSQPVDQQTNSHHVMDTRCSILVIKLQSGILYIFFVNFWWWMTYDSLKWFI